MNSNHLITGCASCPMNRRNFLTRAGTATVGALGALTAPTWLNAAEPKEKTRIRVIYALARREPDRAGLAQQRLRFPARVMERIKQDAGATDARSSSLSPRWPTARSRPRRLVEEDKAAGALDGYLVYQMNCWNRVVQTIGGFRQAGALCRFPVRRQRRLPGL